MANEIMSLDKRAALLSSQTTQWITDNIANPHMALAVPEGYNVGNEVSSLIYAISQTRDKDGRSALDICTPDQIMNQVRDCILDGLSIHKKHVWPIIYGGKLSLQVSVYGKTAAFKYMFPDYEIGANVLYEGDSYDYCTDPVTGYNYVTNVHSSLENRDRPIIGAYGSIYDIHTKERIYGCVMTIKEIHKNWEKSKNKDNAVQRDFPQEMAKRTLINRMVKFYVNSPNVKKSAAVDAFNRMTANEYDDDNLTNVTPPASEIEKQEMLRGKSKGSAGLKSLLEADKGKVISETQNAPEEPKGEVIPPTPIERDIATNKSESAKTTTPEKPSTLGRKPSIRLDEWGNAVPNDDDEPGPRASYVEEGSLFADDQIPF